jgi:hypothetical protein
MSKSEPTYTFRTGVVIFWEHSLWIAQGLDYDITGHGNDVESAIENLVQTLVGQILIDVKHGERPLANTLRAPKFYWDKFHKAKQLTEKREKRFSIPEEVLPAYMIEANDLRIAA